MIVLGAGESGVGAALLARHQNLDVFVSNDEPIKSNYKEEMLSYNISFEEGGHSYDKIFSADIIIKSPGIAQNNSLVKEIKKRNIPIISEIEWAYQFYDGNIIAITGTNGKTTTALLIYHFLKKKGFNVGLAGNIGESFSRKLLQGKFDYLVLEVSSFQLEDIHNFKPNIAVILNITPDHLDRYNNRIDDYINTKFKLVKNMTKEDLLVCHKENYYIKKWVQNHSITPCLISCSPQLDKQNFLSVKNPIDKNQTNTFHDLPLLGKHNALNITASIQIVMHLGFDYTFISQTLSTFKNAPHRLEKICQSNGITFINDSKATNIESVFYALDSFSKPIIWIAGGIDKGNDYNKILSLVRKKVKVLICLGNNTEKIKIFFSRYISKIYQTRDMEEAVRKAYATANRGDTVLFSPACASFDLFASYEERGNKFIKAVQKCINKLSVN